MPTLHSTSRLDHRRPVRTWDGTPEDWDRWLAADTAYVGAWKRHHQRAANRAVVRATTPQQRLAARRRHKLETEAEAKFGVPPNYGLVCRDRATSVDYGTHEIHRGACTRCGCSAAEAGAEDRSRLAAVWVNTQLRAAKAARTTNA